MRIKFLSIIASLFMVSFVITSCFGDDNDIEYSPDATIHAFELDTIYGINYKFTIDQQKGEIYNEDSLPVHADTIIDRILIKTLTTASGIITMKNKDDQDSIIIMDGNQVMDSMDLRKPVTLKVYAPNYQQTKTYTINVRVHKYDPDSLSWNYMGEIDNTITEEQKAVILGDDILNYTILNKKLNVFWRQIGSKSSWTSALVEGDIFNNTLPTSILSYDGKLYATSSINDGIVYESTNGTTWTASELFSNRTVSLLLAPLSNKITFIETINDKKYFNSTDEIKKAKITDEEQLQEVPKDFPIGNISYTTYSTATKREGIMLIGKCENQPTVGDSNTKTIVPWGYMGDIWVSFAPNNTTSSCPEIENPSIIYYNDQFYIFGDGFKSFYVSKSGLAWKKATKFSFPNYNWSASGVILRPTIDDPEFRGRKNYATVQDTKNEYIYILFGSESGITFSENIKVAGSNTLVDRGPYNHDSEVWRGRLNQLWFDLAKSPKQ